MGDYLRTTLIKGDTGSLDYSPFYGSIYLARRTLLTFLSTMPHFTPFHGI